ncbi:hypothetical protein ACLOJK_016540 [Asimina triloba]
MDGWNGIDEASELRGSSETSGITLEDDDSSGFAWKQESAAEIHKEAKLSIQRGESMSTEWTDEKHSMYLNSMEASFVKQLYCDKYQLMDLHGSRSRKRLLNQNSLQSNASTHSSSGQFKVLRGGCWEKLYIGTDETQLGNENEYQHLLGNPWIDHFRSTSRGKRLEETFPGQKRKSFGSGPASSSKRPWTSCADIYNQDSVGSNTEMSDQNFGDNGFDKGKRLTNLCAKKRSMTAAVDDSSKDQVVPSGKSSAAARTSENYTSQQNTGEEYRDRHSGNKTGSGMMTSVPPSFEDP